MDRLGKLGEEEAITRAGISSAVWLGSVGKFEIQFFRATILAGVNLTKRLVAELLVLVESRSERSHRIERRASVGGLHQEAGDFLCILILALRDAKV